jgi:hypothetical protein
VDRAKQALNRGRLVMVRGPLTATKIKTIEMAECLEAGTVVTVEVVPVVVARARAMATTAK